MKVIVQEKEGEGLFPAGGVVEYPEESAMAVALSQEGVLFLETHYEDGRIVKYEKIEEEDTSLEEVSWTCEIGPVLRGSIPEGEDPLRQSVEQTFFNMFGVETEVTSSGWGDTKKDVIDPIEMEL